MGSNFRFGFSSVRGIGRVLAMIASLTAMQVVLHAQALTASFLNPASANAGDAGLTLTVVGNGFVTGSVIFFSNQALPTQLVSANQLSASIPGQLLAAPGQQLVSVLNPSGSRSGTLTFTINAAPLSITAAALPSSQARVAYSATLSASGGTPPYIWTGVDALPAGLSITPSGQLAGTPVSQGNFTFTVRVTDTGQRSATKTLSLSVAAAAMNIVTAASLPAGTEGVAYSLALAAENGTAPLRWATGIGLPPGLSVDPATGLLSGTLTSRGTYTFSVQVTDNGGAKAEKTFTLTVQPPPLVITTISPLFAGTVGSAYSQVFTATGGTPPYTWTLNSRVPGLTFDPATGILSGTPSQTASQTITVQVADSANVKNSKDFTFTVEQPQLRITNSTPLPPGTTGSVYQQRFIATGGRDPYTWAVTSGSVPGLVLDGPTGIFSGTPTGPGLFTTTIAVRDGTGASASRSFSVTIAPGALAFTSAVEPFKNTVGDAFSFSPSVSGGIPPYTWSVNGLPTGLDIDPATGQITGKAGTVGSFPFTVRVTDSARATAVALFQLDVIAPALPTLSAPAIAETAKSADQFPIQMQLSAPYSLPLTGQLTLTFAPDSGLNDPAVQFSTGGRSVGFTIPAGSTDAQFSTATVGLQTGTVAGTITLLAQMQTQGATLTPTPVTVRSIRIDRTAPAITTASFSRISSTVIEVRVTGYSNSREMTQGVFRFRAAPGTSLTTSELTLALDNVFARWFSDSDAAQYGGQFTFSQQFTIQGDANGVVPASVTLTNRTGTTTTDIK